MKKYEITWIEFHSAFLDAEDEDEAISATQFLDPKETYDDEEDPSVFELDEKGDRINE